MKPLAGGQFTRDGRYVPETYPPDPHALHSPAEALAHYIGGSGKPVNYYFNSIDTSGLTPSKIPAVQEILASRRPGVYEIRSASVEYDMGKRLSPRNFSSAATIGGLVPLATGRLMITPTGEYRFEGFLHAREDSYDFKPRKGRSWQAELSTRIGATFPGKEYKIHIIGSKPFSRIGRVVPLP